MTKATDTDWCSEQECELYEAAGVLPADLSADAARVVRWLAGWDDHTTRGVEELLVIARARAVLDNEQTAEPPCVCPEGDTLALCRVHGLDYDGDGDLTAAAREVVATVGTRTDPVMGELAAAADEWDWVLVPRDRIDALAATLGGS